MKTPRKSKAGRNAESCNKDVWFPAKRYGYGWGFPVKWQGWVVLVSYVALSVLVAVMPATQPPHLFFSAIALLTAGLLVICYKKGVRPRWQWGDEDR